MQASTLKSNKNPGNGREIRLESRTISIVDVKDRIPVDLED